MTKFITSSQNILIKRVLRLLEKPKAREEENCIIIEGLREVTLSIQAGFRISSLLFCQEILRNFSIDGLGIHMGTDVEFVEVTKDIYNRMAHRKDNGGVIALAEPKRIGFPDLILRPVPLLLVIESVEKPGNLGALLRTADAANLDAVIICDPQTDIYNPNAIRSSIGCVFTLPVVTATKEETLRFLRDRKIRSFGTALTATQLYHQIDFCQPAAILMGTEATGLSDTFIEGADVLIKIPMMGKIDSMNVSASAAIVIFEALRQRNFQ
ncbi:MAG: RNA methyltransferase [Bacteroidales bacterium]|nr:RNA methyltransferase [Bacteroidales bacterium]MDD4602432.1 RNA methyltransferase [Bacteroidales bacterium]